MSDLPKPVAYRSRWPELETWKLTEYLTFLPRQEVGREIDPLFTAEQVAELMHKASYSPHVDPARSDWTRILAEFCAAYCPDFTIEEEQ